MESVIRSRNVGKHKLHRIRPQRFLAIALSAALSYLLTGHARADEQGRWHLMVEPAFMQPGFPTAIAGSQKTLIAPAIVRGDIVTFLDAERKEALGVKLDSVQRVAALNASEELAKLTPKMIRDPHGVIQAAVIDSDRPVVAATTLAPDFIEKFEAVFGPDLLVAIPNRYRVYVYPALASKFEATASAVINDYRLTPYPVSQEVFRVLPGGGLEAVGTFEPAPGEPENPF